MIDVADPADHNIVKKKKEHEMIEKYQDLK